MTHFSILVPARDEDELFQKLLPYYEYGCGVELDELVRPYLQFETTHRCMDFQADAEIIVKDAEKIKSEYLDDYRRWLAARDFARLFETWEGGETNAEGDWGHWRNPNAKWDWYQVGGRFTGILSDGYDPEQDPANWEICSLCNGSGNRSGWVTLIAQVGKVERIFLDDWAKKYNGCNGCHGIGAALKWPTQWRKVLYDSLAAGDIDFKSLRERKLTKAEKDWDAVAKAVEPEFFLAGKVFREAKSYLREHNLRDWAFAHLESLRVADYDPFLDLGYRLGDDHELYILREGATLTYALITLSGRWFDKSEALYGPEDYDERLILLSSFVELYWKEVLSWPSDCRIFVIDCHG